MKIRPIILSGGSGTRLWPVSRTKAPKQFVPLVGPDSLFVLTAQSGRDAALFASPMVVGNHEHKFLIQDGLDHAAITASSILLEPNGRNTAAAALVAALAETDHDTLHLVRPSDHLIADLPAFHKAVIQAAPAAASGLIVLFGITPEYAETGFGYIQTGDMTAFDNIAVIKAFKEKPDTATASALIQSGALWNSGIFLYAPKTLIAEAEKLAPNLLRQTRAALAGGQQDARGILLDAAAYDSMESEPFDRVFMEKTNQGAVVPCRMGWSDVGSWQAIWQTSTHDAQGNATTGHVVLEDTHNSFIRTEGPTVAVLGMRDIAVIATKDAVLVTPRDRSQDVKKIVASVAEKNASLAQEHPRARRPWGAYETVAQGSHFQVKHITVVPGRSLSLQMHHHRAEHWIVVAGTALVECDGVEKMVFPNESAYIPKGSKHRLTNPGKVELHLIEVQSGDYLGEDDIVRFADVYGRTGKN